MLFHYITQTCRSLYQCLLSNVSGGFLVLCVIARVAVAKHRLIATARVVNAQGASTLHPRSMTTGLTGPAFLHCLR